MTAISDYIERFKIVFPAMNDEAPWHITSHLSDILMERMSQLGSDFKIFNKVAIHKSADIGTHATIKGPAIISANCFVGSHAYLRSGIFLDENVSIGPGCEVKTSLLFNRAALGHFNFVGDSIIGAHVNLEAGAIVANHYNERTDKTIRIIMEGNTYEADVEKFGALVGDHTKIGANAVLSPGTVLKPRTVVGRLQLIEQLPSNNPSLDSRR